MYAEPLTSTVVSKWFGILLQYLSSKNQDYHREKKHSKSETKGPCGFATRVRSVPFQSLGIVALQATTALIKR